MRGDTVTDKKIGAESFVDEDGITQVSIFDRYDGFTVTAEEARIVLEKLTQVIKAIDEAAQ